MSEQPAAAPDPEIESFDAVFVRLGGFDDRIDTEWADGYLTAVAASWREIGIDEWLPAMCGDAFDRAFADPDDVARAKQALGGRLRGLRQALDPQALLDEPDMLHLAPLMTEWGADAQAQPAEPLEAALDELPVPLTGVWWAEGFLDAVADFSTDWPEPDERDPLAPAYEGLLLALGVLAHGTEDEPFAGYLRARWPDAAPTRSELIDDALFAVQDLRIWWLDHGPKIAPRRVETAPGRNEPCPCGSGRKYKKCHGAMR